MNFIFDLLPKLELHKEIVDDKRFYINKNKKYESVTSILKNNEDLNWLKEWENAVGKEVADNISRKARERGILIHKYIENFILDDTNSNQDIYTSPFLKKRLNDVKELLLGNLHIVHGIEMPLYSDILNTAGTTDLCGIWKGDNAIIDYKTSSRIKYEDEIRSYFLQTTCYSMMMEEIYDVPIKKIVIILIPDFDDVIVFERNPDNYKDEIVDIFVNKRK